MTDQEIFETVARHLFAQGKQSVNESGTCMYRGPDGTKYAVGVLIPDEIYDPEMEGLAAWEFGSLWEKFPQLDKLFIEERQRNLLSNLQDVHDDPDTWESTDSMRDYLNDVGKQYILDTAFLNDLSFADR